jgi:hypothetical protein
MDIPLNAHGLPRGAGSLKKRKQTWWMVYPDPFGRIIQESTHTGDYQEARIMLAENAIATTEARLAVMRMVARRRLPYERTNQSDAQTRTGTAGRRDPHRATTAANARNRKTNSQRRKKGTL